MSLTKKWKCFKILTRSSLLRCFRNGNMLRDSGARLNISRYEVRPIWKKMTAAFAFLQHQKSSQSRYLISLIYCSKWNNQDKSCSRLCRKVAVWVQDMFWNFYLVKSHKIANKSAARFCCQVAAWVTDMYRNFYLVKSHKIAHNSATTEAGEKISTDLQSSDFLIMFDVCLTKFENYQFF